MKAPAFLRHLSRFGFSTQHATTKMNVDVFNKLLAKIHTFTSSAWLPRHITAFREVLAPLPVASRYATCTCTTASGGCRGATSMRRSSPTGGEGCAPVMSVQSLNKYVLQSLADMSRRAAAANLQRSEGCSTKSGIDLWFRPSSAS